MLLLQACRVPPPPQWWRFCCYTDAACFLIKNQRWKKKPNKKSPKTNTKSDNMETHQCQSYNKRRLKKKKKKSTHTESTFLCLKWSYFLMIHFFSILNYTFEIYLAVGMTVFPYLYPTLYFFFYNWHFICRWYLQIWSFNIIICILYALYLTTYQITKTICNKLMQYPSTKSDIPTSSAI